MENDHLEITPSVTVHRLLETYPELEEVLIGMAPPFKKLRNPILRRSVAKVATLKHAASVGNVPLNDLIRRLREFVGQPTDEESYIDENYLHERPDWFNQDKVAVSIDEEKSPASDQMTVVEILRKAKDVGPGELIELRTSFLPAPGIELLKTKGYSYWVKKETDSSFKSYFLKQ